MRTRPSALTSLATILALITTAGIFPDLISGGSIDLCVHFLPTRRRTSRQATGHMRARNRNSAAGAG